MERPGDCQVAGGNSASGGGVIGYAGVASGDETFVAASAETPADGCVDTRFSKSSDGDRRGKLAAVDDAVVPSRERAEAPALTGGIGGVRVGCAGISVRAGG